MRRSVLALLIATIALAPRVDAARPLTASLRFAQDSANRVDLGNSATAAGNTTFTWVMVFRRTADQSAAQGRNVVSRGVFNSNFQAVGSIARSGGASPNKLSLFIQLSVTSVNFNSTSALVLNHWYCAAISFDGTATGQMILFGSPDGEPEVVSNTGSGTLLGVGTAHLFLGNNTEPPTNAAGFDMAFFAVYNRVLTKAEVGRLSHNTNAPILGLQGKWRPGTNGTGPVIDESGNVNHGTITGAIPISEAPALRGFSVR